MIKYIDGLIENKFSSLGKEKLYVKQLIFTQILVLAAFILVIIPAFVWQNKTYIHMSALVGIVLCIPIGFIYYRIARVYDKLFKHR